MEKALECFHRVKSEADEPNLQKRGTVNGSVFVFCSSGAHGKVIDILEPVEVHADSPETTPCFCNIGATGNDREAKKNPSDRNLQRDDDSL